MAENHEIVIPEVPDSGTILLGLLRFVSCSGFAFQSSVILGLSWTLYKDRSLNCMAGNTISINVAAAVLAVLLAGVSFAFCSLCSG